jgi:hypothetical protein
VNVGNKVAGNVLNRKGCTDHIGAALSFSSSISMVAAGEGNSPKLPAISRLIAAC